MAAAQLGRVVSSIFSSALIGAVAGSLAALLMAAIAWFTALAWGPAVLNGFPSQAPVLWQALVPIAIGLAIGLLRRRGLEPLPELHQTLEQLHSKQGMPLKHSGSHLLLGLLALVGGGSLGPEALLSRALAVLVLSQKRLRLHGAAAVSGALGFIGSPLLGGVAIAERQDQPLPAGLWSWLPGLVSGTAGFAAFQGFSRFGGGEQGVTYQWPNDLEQSLVFFAWGLFFGLLGGGLGMLFLGLRQRLQQLIARWKLAVLPQALGTGVVVALVNHWQPLALFSGEQQITALLQGKLLQGALPMLLLGLLKLLLAVLCLSTGWVGGLFFPLIFGAAAIAQAIALILPDSVPAQVAIGAMACSIQSAVLGQALLPILVTATVLKAHGLGAVLVGSVMGLGVRNLLLNGDIIPKN